MGDVEAAVAEHQAGGVHAGDAIPARTGRHHAAGRDAGVDAGAGRSEQAGGQRLAVPAGAGVVGSERLQQVEEFLPGRRILAHPVEQPVEQLPDLDPPTSICWAASRASASSRRVSAVSGIRPRRAMASSDSPRAINRAARPVMAPAWSGCSSRARRNGSSVPSRTLRPPAGRPPRAQGAARPRTRPRRLGLGPDELVHHLAVLQGEHRRDGLHLEAGPDGRILVHVDLGQGHRTLGLVDDPLDDRPQGEARTAPRGPQVHHHRDLRGTQENLLLECGIGDIDHGARRYRERPRHRP